MSPLACLSVQFIEERRVILKHPCRLPLRIGITVSNKTFLQSFDLLGYGHAWISYGLFHELNVVPEMITLLDQVAQTKTGQPRLGRLLTRPGIQKQVLPTGRIRAIDPTPVKLARFAFRVVGQHDLICFFSIHISLYFVLPPF